MKIQLINLGRAYTYYSGGHLPYLRFKVIIDGKNIADIYDEKELKENLSYWKPRSQTLGMTCWGTSQIFEARIAVGRFLKWNSKDWSAFSRKIEKTIEIID